MISVNVECLCYLLLLPLTFVLYCNGDNDESCQNPMYMRTFRWSTIVPFDNCLQPSSEEEVISMVNMAVSEGAKIRAIGKSFNWGPGGMLENKNFYTGENQTIYTINMTAGNMTKYSVNTELMTMTFEAGLRVIDVVEILEEYGMGLKHFGGPLIVNFVGSFITGTHGKGSSRTPSAIMANDVIEFRMVTANGSVIVANSTYNNDIFYAGLVSNGVLGIITQVTVQAIPLYYILRDTNLRWNDVYEYNEIESIVKVNLSKINQEYDGISGAYQVVRQFFQWQRFKLINESEFDLNETNFCWDEEIKNWNNFPCNDAYFRALSPYPTRSYFFSRNQEVEFFVFEDDFEKAYLTGIKWVLNQKIENPLIWNQTLKNADPNGGPSGEIQIGTRVIGNDNIWLSPGYGNKNVVQISLYMPGTFDQRVPDYLYNFWNFGFYKAIRKQIGTNIRIHLGKASLRGYCDIKDSYPKLNDFIQLRNILDPNEIFLNAMMRDKLGICDNSINCCCTLETCLTREDPSDYLEDDDNDETPQPTLTDETIDEPLNTMDSKCNKIYIGDIDISISGLLFVLYFIFHLL